jgi:hypothetical protein
MATPSTYDRVGGPLLSTLSMDEMALTLSPAKVNPIVVKYIMRNIFQPVQ